MVVTGVLVIVIAALLIALIPWLRKSGARDKALDELIALGPDLKALVTAFKGDSSTEPPTKGLRWQVSTQGRQIEFLADKAQMTDPERRAYQAIGGP